MAKYLVGMEIMLTFAAVFAGSPQWPLIQIHNIHSVKP